MAMPLAPLAPEARLLLLCAGGADDATLRRALVPPLDWPAVLRLAEREGASPLLWERLAALAPEHLPRAAAERLRALARVKQFKMRYMAQRVAETVAALDAAGIESVLLKGAALAVAAYGSFERRPMIDVDILVRPTESEAALAVLLDAGWQWREDRERHADYGHLHHLPALLDARGVEISLELHTALLPAGQPFALDAATVLASARRTAGGAPVPDPYLMLLHTCIHFVWGHMLRKGAVRSFRDVAVILATFEVDPARFAAAARAARATTVCYWTLRLAAAVAGVAVPPALLAPLRPPQPDLVLRALERHFALILLPGHLDCPSVTLRQLLWTVAVRPRRSGHGASRPWQLLTLTPEEHRTRAAAMRREQPPATASRAGTWMRYGRAVLLPPVAPGRVVL